MLCRRTESIHQPVPHVLQYIKPSYLVMHIEILSQRVAAGRDGFIVRNLAGVIQSAQVDAVYHRCRHDGWSPQGRLKAWWLSRSGGCDTGDDANELFPQGKLKNAELVRR